MKDLVDLAALIAQRNELDAAIGVLVGRPALVGHMGEYIAARVFDIALEGSATARGLDGRFRVGPLAGRPVNVKWYPQREGGLDLAVHDGPDFYLVLAGPRAAAVSSRGALRPLTIETVYLFEGAALLAALRARGVRLGTFTSVHGALWAAAEIYPHPNNPRLPVTEAQAALLALFRRL